MFAKILRLSFATSTSPVYTSDTQAPTRLAKVRGTFLPQEYHLVRLIEGIENQHSSWNTGTPACKWHGIQCNEEGEVISISWLYCNLCGELSWKYLPPTLFISSLYDNKLCGNVPFSSLPKKLDLINLSQNRFSGEPNLRDLPPLLTYLDIGYNHFEGHVDLDSLPVLLTDLYLASNQGLEGILDLEGRVSHFCYSVLETHITTSNGKLCVYSDDEASE